MVAARWVCGVFGLVLIAMLVTARTFNPLRGTNPLIVTRQGQPALYWMGIAFWAFLLAVMAWVGFLRPAAS